MQRGYRLRSGDLKESSSFLNARILCIHKQRRLLLMLERNL